MMDRAALGARTRHQRFAAPPPATIFLVGAAGAAAATVGLLAAISPSMAAGALVALLALPVAVVRPRLVLHVLAPTVFLEAITVGGVTVGRLAAPLALLAVLSHLINGGTRLRGGALTAWLGAGYAALAAASYAWTVSPAGTTAALGSLAVSLAYGAAFALLLADREVVRSLLWSVTASAVLLSGFWLTQFLTGAARQDNAAGDPNFVAAFLVMAIPLVLVNAAHERTRLRRGLAYLALAPIAGAVVATLSRGGFGAIVLVASVIALVRPRALFPSGRTKAAFFGAAGIGLALLLPLAWAGLAERFSAGFSQTASAVGGRSDLWKAALHAFRLHPLAGLGYGGFRATSFTLLAATPGVNLVSHLRSAVWSGEYAHSAFLGSLAELGPLGFALLVGVILSAWASLRRTARRARIAGDGFLRATSNALSIALASYAASSFLLSTETSRALWLLVGLSVALARMPTPGPERTGPSA